MKKRSVKRASSRKTTRQTRKGLQHILLLPFSFRRIVLITTCIAIFAFAFNFVHKHGTQGVAGIDITRGLFSQATVTLPTVENAVSYSIYYKKDSENQYKNAVTAIPTDVKTYIISYLTKGATYKYKIAAVDGNGAEFWWSGEQTLTNLQPM